MALRKNLEISAKHVVLWRGALLVFLFVGLSFMAERTPNSQKDYWAFPTHYFLDGFFRFDTGWFARIAEKGYYIEGSMSDVVFFPLYPYLARFFGWIIGNHFMAGLIISNLALIAGLALVRQIAQPLVTNERADRALILLLTFPGAFYFSCYYSESLFLFLSAASILCFLKKEYLIAGAWGFFAALTRSQAQVLLVAYAAHIFWEHRRRKLKLDGEMFWLLLIPLGLLLFMVLLDAQVRNPWAFIDFQAGWGRKTGSALSSLIAELGRIDLSFPRSPGNMLRVINLSAAVLFLGSGYQMLKKNYPVVLGVYVMGSVLLPICTGTILSMVRLVSVLFPVFIFWADQLRNERLWTGVVAGGFIFLGLFSLLFMNWYWVA